LSGFRHHLARKNVTEPPSTRSPSAPPPSAGPSPSSQAPSGKGSFFRLRLRRGRKNPLSLSTSQWDSGPVRPAPRPEDKPKLLFRRARKYPRAIAWFGARSFWGHLWHLAASVLATEDIDSRDWMRADEPEELTRRIATALGASESAPTLTECIQGDLWIDFVADTGDCVSVSAEVARLIFRPYEVPDPSDPGKMLTLPRGHLLLFGGDTAYPVATELEIHNRVIVPWNRVLRGAHDGKNRVLLGVPGNHDWYGGLDGFGRMFRARRGRVARTSQLPADTIDTSGQIGHFIQWIEAFRVGRFVGKRPALPLEGYSPVLSATYWALRLAPGLDLWGADRQLRAVDFHQRCYFADVRDEERGIVLCIADPVQAFLEPNAAGIEILNGLDLSVERDKLLVLSGDTHHYCREHFGDGVHVTAGGGGAFLHPARITRKGFQAPAAEFPGPIASLALALQIPWQIVHGRSGFLVHFGLAIAYAPMFSMEMWRGGTSLWAAACTAVVVAVICLLIGGWRSKNAIRIGLLASLTGAVIGFLPIVIHLVIRPLLGRFSLPFTGVAAIELLIAVYLATLSFGTYLMLLTILGLEQHQAFSALAHPGYKHFVRLRVRSSGEAIDAWVLGKVDPLNPESDVVLVDHFTWQNQAARSGKKSA
jgi:hypothetical protein